MQKLKKILLYKRFGFKFLYKKIYVLFFPLKKGILHKEIFCRLNKMFARELENFEEKNNYISVIEEDLPIWVCWWQGIENAPGLVKKCVESIRQNANGHPVHIISQNNLKEYLDTIPPVIFSRIKEKKYSYAYLADLIRFNLLSKYGGFWIDATMFLAKPLPKQIDAPIFSLKRPLLSSDNHVSQKRWSAFFLASAPSNPYIEFLRRLMTLYVERNDVLIDYLLIDYCISLMYNRYSVFRKMIDDIPMQKDDVYALQESMNKPATLELYDDFVESHPYNKLSWKKQCLLRTNDGEKTFYSFFISHKWS